MEDAAHGQSAAESMISALAARVDALAAEVQALASRNSYNVDFSGGAWGDSGGGGGGGIDVDVVTGVSFFTDTISDTSCALKVEIKTVNLDSGAEGTEIGQIALISDVEVVSDVKYETGDFKKSVKAIATFGASDAEESTVFSTVSIN